MSQTTSETPSPHSWPGFVAFVNVYGPSLSSEKVRLLYIAVGVREENVERAIDALADIACRPRTTDGQRHRPNSDSLFTGPRVVPFTPRGVR